MIRRPPRSTLSSSSAASDVYKRQPQGGCTNNNVGNRGQQRGKWHAESRALPWSGGFCRYPTVGYRQNWAVRVDKSPHRLGLLGFGRDVLPPPQRCGEGLVGTRRDGLDDGIELLATTIDNSDHWQGITQVAQEAVRAITDHSQSEDDAALLLLRLP